MREKKSWAVEFLFAVVMGVLSFIGNYYLFKITTIKALMLYGIVAVGIFFMFFLIFTSMSFVSMQIDIKGNQIKIAGGIILIIIGIKALF